MCGILGSKYGLGRKLAYFAEGPQNFDKAMLVGISVSYSHSNLQQILIVFIVLVVGDDILRVYLCRGEDLYYHDLSSHHCQSHPRLDPLRSHLTDSYGQSDSPVCHYLPVPAGRLLLESTIRKRHMR